MISNGISIRLSRFSLVKASSSEFAERGAARRLWLCALLLLLVTTIACRSLLAQDGEGSATIAFGDTVGSHIQVPVDTRGTFILRYRVGPSGMKIGAALDVLRRGQWDFRFGASLQTTDPQGPGYVRATTARANVQLRFQHLSDYFKHQHVLRLRIEGQPLQPGDNVEIHFGDRASGGAGIVTHAVAHQERTIHISTDGDGDGEFQRLSQVLRVDLVPGPVERVSLVAPSEVEAGERFDVLLRVEDRNCNLQPRFAETITITSRDPERNVVFSDEETGELRPTTKVIVASRGATRFGALIRQPGVFWLQAQTDGGLTAYSNPIQVARGVGSSLWWGDLHVHTFLSDGTDSLAENFEFARNVAGLDFVALTDHLHPDSKKGETLLDPALRFAIRNGLAESQSLPTWWRHQVEVAERFHNPPRFSTLFAYEWSGRIPIGGDHNVYFARAIDRRGRPTQSEQFPLIAPQNLDSLYRSLTEANQSDVVVIPHVGGRIGNWNFHRPEVETALEICSVHGHFEWFAQEALQRGYRTAFVGAGDNHHGRPGYSVWHRFGRMKFRPRGYGVPGGIAAVRAATIERAELIQALRRRRVYATTGVRIWVSFTVNSQPMGESLTVDKPPTLAMEVHGTGPIERVEVIRDQHRIARFDAGKWSFETTFDDRSITPGWHYYYVRITQVNGEMAWASPIWVNYTGEVVEAQEYPAWNDDGQLEEWLIGGESIDSDVTTTLRSILEKGAPGRYVELEPIRAVANSRGDYFLYFAHDSQSEGPVRIRYYDDFEQPRLHIYPGWGDYGPLRR